MIYTMGESILAMMHTGVDTFTKKTLIGPSNVSKSIKDLGGSSVFVGKLSNDRFGQRIIKSLKEEGIYHELDLSDKQTAVAFVFGELSDNLILFYRDDSADLHLDIEDIHSIHFREYDILYVTSFGFVPQATTQVTHFHAINKCKLAGGLVCSDLSYYEGLWNYEAYAQETFLNIISQSDIVRVSKEECYWLSGFENIEYAMRCLQTHHQIIISTNENYDVVILDHHSNFFEIKTESKEFYTNKDQYAKIIASLLNDINLKKCSLDNISSQDIQDMAYRALLNATS